MGYRIYDNASSTRARFHRDYEGVKFKLLDLSYDEVKPEPVGALTTSTLAGIAVLALSFF